MDQESHPIKASRLYVQPIEGYHLCYNPCGSGGILILDDEAMRLVGMCDGRHCIGDIQRCSPSDRHVTLAALNKLRAQDIIHERPPSSSPATARSRAFACWLHITNRCNLACSYCYIRKTNDHMRPPLAFSVIRTLLHTCEVNDLHTLHIKYAGGEPLLERTLLFELIAFARRHASSGLMLEQSVITNGTLVSHSIAGFFKTHRIRVGVSLDGLGPANGNRVFPNGQSSWQATLRGIDTLVRHGITPTVLITVTDQNYAYLPETTEYLLTHGLKFRFSLERAYPKSEPELVQWQPQLIEALMECYDLIESSLPDDDIMGIHSFNDTRFDRPREQVCGAGRSFLAIDHAARVGLCGMGLATPIWRFTDGQDLLQKLKEHAGYMTNCARHEVPGCSDCPWIYSCAGGCPLLRLSANGGFQSMSPYCEVYKKVLPRILQIRGLQMLRTIRQ